MKAILKGRFVGVVSLACCRAERTGSAHRRWVQSFARSRLRYVSQSVTRPVFPALAQHRSPLPPSFPHLNSRCSTAMGKTGVAAALVAGTAAAAAAVLTVALSHDKKEKEKAHAAAPVPPPRSPARELEKTAAARLTRVMDTDETGRPSRHGVYRELWLTLSDHADYPLAKTCDQYFELCAMGPPADAELCAVIERDLPRTFPKMDLFQVTPSVSCARNHVN